MINDFIKHCHIDYVNIIVDFLIIVLWTKLVWSQPNGVLVLLIRSIRKKANLEIQIIIEDSYYLFTACKKERLSDNVQLNILGEEQAATVTVQ